MEIWKDISNFEGLYQVSNYGNVRALNYKRQKKKKNLILCKNRDGYLQVSLYKNNKLYSKSVHRLVAETFIPNFRRLSQVNHKDENKQNNCVNNLEWCTASYNINYGERTEKTRKKIIQLDKKNNIIKLWNSIIEIEEKMNIPHSNIIYCCQGKRKTAGNYIWKYKEG